MRELITKYVKEFESHNFKCTHIYDHGFNVVVNDLQDIFIRPLGNKCSASLSPNSTLFSNIYIESNWQRKEIGFKGEKTPKSLFDDINKRLITSEFCIKQWNRLNAIKQSNDEYNNKRDAVKNEIDKLNLDLRHNDSNDEYSLYYKKAYGRVKYYSDSVTIDLSSLDIETAMKILRLLEE